jgi:DNA-binding phage protein
MKSVKTLTSDSWLNSLIDSLQDPEEAANYLSVILEDNPQSDQILKATLQDLVAAQIRNNNFNDQSQVYYQQLLEIFAKNQEDPIYIFINLLKSMNFKLIVAVNDD